MWKDLTKESMVNKDWYQFFLVRPKGLHPASGKKFTALVVQYGDGHLYTPDNEVEPIIYSHKDDVMTPSNDPFECNLEWMEIPE